jgi:hypothetical protein
MSDSLQVFEHHVCSGVNLVIPASRPDVLHPDLHVAYYHLKDQNQIIAWKKLPETLKLSGEEPVHRSLAVAFVHPLNHSLCHEHLRLVVAKICAQLPAAAAIAHMELMTPVSLYDNPKTAAFLRIDYSLTSRGEKLPSKLVIGVVHAFNVGASELILLGPKRNTSAA